MNWIWVLVAMPLASLVYFAYKLSRDNTEHATRYVHKIAKAILPIRLRSGLFQKGERPISWVSEREFGALVRTSDDVILVDLASDRNGKPDAGNGSRMLFNAPNVLLIEQRGLLDVLRWASSTSSVVLYGSRDVCASAIPAIRKVAGSAPVYLMPETPNSSRAA
jgi:hypothetical protein